MSNGIDLSGLDQFNSASFLEGAALDAASNGKPLLISLDKIQPDPDQPRQKIDPNGLEELADSIRERGVKSPISVKPQNQAGIYLINHGERRFHACRAAGLTEIPAFIDADHNSYDQVIENIQRENLTALEIAHFIERRIEAGDKKGEIAKKLGRPASYISDHALFFQFPERIRDLYDSGRCRAIQALALLHRVSEEFTEQVVDFCYGDREITTSEVRSFVTALKTKPCRTAEKPPEAPGDENQGLGQGIGLPRAQAGDLAPSGPDLEAGAATKSTISGEAGVEPSLHEQFERILQPLESYLKDVSDPVFRARAGKRLREIADKYQ